MLCLYNSLSGPFERFSFNFTQCQGHTSMLWDLPFDFERFKVKGKIHTVLNAFIIELTVL